MGIVFKEMSSCRSALTRHIGINTAFYTKIRKSEYFGIFIVKILIFRVIEENAYLKKIQPLTTRSS